MTKTKILFVGMPFSIHVARWIENFDRDKFEIHFMSSFYGCKPIAEISNLTYHDFSYHYFHSKAGVDFRTFKNRKVLVKSLTINKFIGKLYRFMRLEGQLHDMLTILIDSIKPDFVHSMESQHAGYSVRKSLNYLKEPSFHWVHSTWGLDIHYFQHFNLHSQEISKMLEKVKTLIIEGDRDNLLAREHGFTGQITKIPCVAGGFRINQYPSGVKTSERKIILVKASQDNVRMGMNTILSLINSIDILEDFDIYFHSADENVTDAVNFLNSRYGYNLKNYVDTNYMGWLEFLSNTRVYVNLNLSDGNPSSLFEAMLCGAFPILTVESTATEWINNKETGILCQPHVFEEVKKALIFATAQSNSEILDSAYKENRRKIESDLNYESINRQINSIFTR
jgi:glycosyltransferase involved in cell wall biosynthesis